MNATDFVIVIPARFESTRLPGKVLADIHGRPMIEHVWHRATASSARDVVIATDSEQVLEAARQFGAQAVMTGAHHNSGSDRIAETAQILNWDPEQLIVNLQGDEPEMPPACLDQVAALLHDHPEAAAATLYWPCATPVEVRDPNVVKVVANEAGDALYFSRSVLPWPRGFGSVDTAFEQGFRWLRHLGVYAYRRHSLMAFTERGPGRLETQERLEQLRFLESGWRIQITQSCMSIPAGVDTAEDLERVRALTDI